MMNELFLPPEASWCYMLTDDAINLENYHRLYPQEKLIVVQSVDKRRAEFGDARWCAHQALEDLGVKPGPILKGARGMPLWPEGVTGALTHTDGLRAAVVAPIGRIRSVGLDAEPAKPLPDAVLDAIARPGERPQLARLASQGVACADRLLFCAKEATYKAWFPMTHRWLGFEQAEIDIKDDGTFISYLLARPTPVPFINGRWRVTNGFVVTATVVERH